jgi:hypothetical protein
MPRLGVRQPVAHLARIHDIDILSIECHWDNSEAHQPVQNGTQAAPKDLYWGEGTGDEMCLGGFYITRP